MWTQTQKWTAGIGLFGIVFALFAVFYWIPTDVESGILEVDRRDVFIGDSMAPFFLAVCTAILGLALVVSAYLESRTGFASSTKSATTANEHDRQDDDLDDLKGTLSRSNFSYLLGVITLVAISLALMVWVGPLTVKVMNMLGFDIGTYRQLTNTFPYKYLGFVTGGFVLVFFLITLIEGKSSLAAALTAIVTLAVLIAVYDGPFDQLLLPPNGG